MYTCAQDVRGTPKSIVPRQTWKCDTSSRHIKRCLPPPSQSRQPARRESICGSFSPNASQPRQRAKQAAAASDIKNMPSQRRLFFPGMEDPNFCDYSRDPSRRASGWRHGSWGLSNASENIRRVRSHVCYDGLTFTYDRYRLIKKEKKN